MRLVTEMRERGLGVIVVSHNMPNVFDTADRIQVMRLGGSAAVITPKSHSMQDAVAIMTGALTVDEADQTLGRASQTDASPPAMSSAGSKNDNTGGEAD